MANREHIKILKQGVKVWNKWRKDNPKIVPDLSNYDFEEIHFDGIDFKNVDLEHSMFFNSSLTRTLFSESNLHFTTFSDVNLSGSNFGFTTLRQVFFSDVYINYSILHYAIFYHVKFKNVDFAFAYMGDTALIGCDLSETVNLDEINHSGPSEISLDSLYKSSGKIPEVFLRKSGVPETFLTYATSLLTDPIEFYSCFISFTEKDNSFSERLYNDMQVEGIRCWRWKEDAKWGKTLRKSIDEAVRIYDKLVVICSKDSLNSPPVLEEIERALNKEDAQMKEGKEGEVLFPITIDNYIFNGWDHYLKDRLLRKTIGDFKGWKRNPEKYKKSVERLVKDLNKHS
jgi:uncharacterized protein YjbI with pentapeptide repeats